MHPHQTNQIETMHDATCERIRAVAEAHNLPLPDALRPTAIPGPKQMYHVNMSGEAPGRAAGLRVPLFLPACAAFAPRMLLNICVPSRGSMHTAGALSVPPWPAP
jgi:hypothetical protein